MDVYQSFPDFLLANKNTVFHYWVYRRLYTPYEQREAFIDESVYEDSVASAGIIRECIALGNGDYLLGFQVVEIGEPPEQPCTGLEYYRLSEIRLGFSRDEQEEE